VASHPMGFLDSLVMADLVRMIAELIIYPRGHSRPEIIYKYCHELKHLYIQIPWCLNSWWVKYRLYLELLSYKIQVQWLALVGTQHHQEKPPSRKLGKTRKNTVISENSRKFD
jgi:hypothetical protein